VGERRIIGAKRTDVVKTKGNNAKNNTATATFARFEYKIAKLFNTHSRPDSGYSVKTKKKKKKKQTEEMRERVSRGGKNFEGVKK